MEKIGIGSKIGENDCESHLFGVHNLKMFASMHAGTKKYTQMGKGEMHNIYPYIYINLVVGSPLGQISFSRHPTIHTHTLFVINILLCYTKQERSQGIRFSYLYFSDKITIFQLNLYPSNLYSKCSERG